MSGGGQLLGDVGQGCEILRSWCRMSPSSEQERNVLGLSSVTIRFVMSLWQYHVFLVVPKGCRSEVYSTSDSFISLSPAHEMIFVLFVCGMNLAENMFPVCPAVRYIFALSYRSRESCGLQTCCRHPILTVDDHHSPKRDILHVDSTYPINTPLKFDDIR